MVECRVTDTERTIGALADRQRGLVTHVQLIAAGLSRKAIERRVRSGRLRVLHRGVYAVGHAVLPEHARELAAVLACGTGALLSHYAAAALWGMRVPLDGPVDVTVVARNPGRRTGVVVHRVAALDPTDITRREGIPVTSPARTVLDLAGSLSAREVERTFDEGRIQGVIAPRAISAVLARYPRRPGAEVLRELTDPHRRRVITRSGSERLFLALIRRARLPLPECNVQLGAFSADFLWREQGLVVELDSYGFHTTRGAFERDHAKDLAFRRRGLDTVRFTALQVMDEPEATLVQVASALAQRGRAA
jgi:very-short-patch-repair endonuclease